jgi:hypothetical protein
MFYTQIFYHICDFKIFTPCLWLYFFIILTFFYREKNFNVEEVQFINFSSMGHTFDIFSKNFLQILVSHGFLPSFFLEERKILHLYFTFKYMNMLKLICV